MHSLSMKSLGLICSLWHSNPSPIAPYDTSFPSSSQGKAVRCPVLRLPRKSPYAKLRIWSQVLVSSNQDYRGHTVVRVLLETNLPITLLHRGKVRDNYELGDKLLIVATDRISAFDVVLPCGIPEKGAVLNLLSAFWFEKTVHLVPNHLIEVVKAVSQLEFSHAGKDTYPELLVNRSMIARRAQRIPVECVVRGYLSGSAWAEYAANGTIHGIAVRPGFIESDRLPQPIFTPTTKADSGHDQPLSMTDLIESVGDALAEELKQKTLAIYAFAEEYARTRGIIIADTKMEFGIVDGQLTLIDELLTPDSSRFWDAAAYEPGKAQPSFDKQMVRDWLTASRWNKEPPAPMLPDDLIKRTSERYREVYQGLTGKNFWKDQE
jgi:phosphoribosylaminoimidazole-succinocarboxamide synthase